MLAEALRLIRVFHDMRSSELAKKLDISTSYLSEIESGKKDPSMDLISRYAEFFNISSSSILFFAEELGNCKNKSLIKSIRQKLLKFLQIVEKGLIHGS